MNFIIFSNVAKKYLINQLTFDLLSAHLIGTIRDYLVNKRSFVSISFGKVLETFRK